MAFNITKISDYSPDSKALYFCDSNIWIAVLQNSGVGNMDAKMQPYVDFFEAVINLNNADPKFSKKIKNKPKFVLTSMLISEIINAYMRQVAMKLFFGADKYRNYDFKKDYRDSPHPDYINKLKALTSDIASFKDYVVLMDDEFSKFDPFKIFSRLKSNADFNDIYYYELLKGKDIPIVTHDKDFTFQDIEIITALQNLLKLK